MKWMLSTLACTLLPGVAAAGPSEDFERGYALAQAKGCLECHAVDTRVVGPSYQAIARRYRHDPGARKRLPRAIRGGSAGHWGDQVVMWPQVRLTSDEAQQLVDWVLSQ